MPERFDDKPPRGSSDPRFDRWLSWRLHDAYDGVLKEKLPADLACLVELLGARDEEADDADEPVDPAPGGASASDLTGCRDGRVPAMLMALGTSRRD